MFYRQCKLQHADKEQTTWIPEKYAKKGKVVRLREKGVWIDGWVVMSVGARASKEQQEMLERSHATTRKVSDI